MMTTPTVTPGSDPLLLRLIAAYSGRDAIEMESCLDQIHTEAASGSLRQETLGTIDCANLIFSFFKGLIDQSTGQTVDCEPTLQISSAFSLNPIDENLKKQQERLIEKSYWVLVRLCRREMSKATNSVQNIALIENYPLSFAMIVSICNLNIKSVLIALPTSWLIMILASDSSERQFQLTAATATMTIVNIMELHKDDTAVAEMVCRAARNIAAGDTDIVAKFVEDKVCDGLVGIIRSQVQQSLVCETWVVAGNAADKGAQNCSENVLATEEAIVKERSPMLPDGEFPVDEAVCEAALWAIVNLACDENVATILGSVGAIEAVVDAASSCRHSSSVALAAVSAIRNISSVGTLNYALLAKTSVCEVLLSLLKKHSSDLELVETGLWALTNLSCDSVLANRLGVLGVSEIVMHLYHSIVPLHPPEGRPAGPLSEVCLWVVINLAANGLENEDRLGAAGAVEVVGLIMLTYALREGMVELALNAFIHLTYHSEDNKARIGGVGVLPEIYAGAGAASQGIFSTLFLVADSYMDNENVAENVLKLFLLSLNGQASSAHNKQQLLALKVLSLTVAIMECHKENPNPEIIRLGCGLMLVVRYDDVAYKQHLGEGGQLDGAGKASPKGTYADIALAWGLSDVETYVHTQALSSQPAPPR